MRFKKQIIIICLFTFLFVPFNRTVKTSAEPITLTTSALYLLYGALATACGVVILNDDMLADVGERMDSVLNKFVTVNNDTYVIERTAEVMALALNVALSLPKDDHLYSYPYLTINQDGTIKQNLTMPKYPKYPDYAIVGTFTASGLPVDGGYISIFCENGNGVGNNRTSRYFAKNGDVLNLYGFESDHGYQTIRFGSLSGATVASVFPGTSISYLFDTRGVQTVAGKSVFIPYNPSVCPDIPSDKVGEKAEELKGGSIVVNPYNPSIDSPLAPEWTNGSISYPLSEPADIPGVSVDTPSVDIPSDEVVDKPNTGDSVFDKFGEWLSTLLASLFKPLVDLLKGILDFLKNLFIPSELIDLDFTPLYFDLTKKFPFCLPFDFARFFTDFNNLKERPILHIQMPEKYFNSYTLDIDLAFYDDYFPFSSILRYFLLISFIYYLIKYSRNIIGG